MLSRQSRNIFFSASDRCNASRWEYLKKATKQIDRLRLDYGVYALFLKNNVSCAEVLKLLFRPLIGHVWCNCRMNCCLEVSSLFRCLIYLLMIFYNKLYGLPTLHPLVTVIDLKKATKQIDRLRLDYGVYALFLKNIMLSRQSRNIFFSASDRCNASRWEYRKKPKLPITGNTPQEIITLYLIAEAKRRLASTDNDISVIAYDLGFQYPQHFTRIFPTIVSQMRLRPMSLLCGGL